MENSDNILLARIDERTKNIPVVVKVYNGPTRENKYQHFVVLTKKEGNNYIIMDPWYEDIDQAGNPKLAYLMPRYPQAPGPKTISNAIEKYVIFTPSKVNTVPEGV